MTTSIHYGVIALVGVGIPSRATYLIGGALRYMYIIFYPYNIRFENLI